MRQTVGHEEKEATMNTPVKGIPIHILLVEDNKSDARLAIEALRDSKIKNTIDHVYDGVEALNYLRREGKYSKAQRPDLILLDLNLPRMNGHDVLAEVKQDKNLRRIPIVVLTISSDEADIAKAYDLHGNCYITKPIDLNQFLTVVKSIEDFWLTIVKLPDRITE
jgi:two-component system, chemotaxis family, response regulator Rcp1